MMLMTTYDQDVNGYNLDKVRSIVESVLKKGRQLERGDQFLATISEVLKRGILTAEQDLKKSLLKDEVSLFRSLPVIGTVLGLMGVGSESQITLISQDSASALVATLNESTVNGGLHVLKKPFARTFTLSSGFSTVPIDTVKASVTRASSVAGGSVVGLFDEPEDSLEEGLCVDDCENLDASESVDDAGQISDLGNDADVEEGSDVADEST
ncbi:hypothetical protein BC830DRAFT_726825 [Chytriomyces sp. MP71]|nr:hypothetical protein BC830DRAFT_726825 [Chytriomyces sp. MP71]